MAKKGGVPGDLFGGICMALTAIGIAATIIKALSPGRKCPECDRALQVVNAAMLICPSCGGYFRRA